MNTHSHTHTNTHASTHTPSKLSKMETLIFIHTYETEHNRKEQNRIE